MVRPISRQRGGLAALKLTKVFGIDDFPAAKDSGKVLIIIIYCYLIIIIIIHNILNQEPITRTLQLPHIPVTAFSQTDQFLVWIYLEFRSPQEPQ